MDFLFFLAFMLLILSLLGTVAEIDAARRIHFSTRLSKNMKKGMPQHEWERLLFLAKADNASFACSFIKMPFRWFFCIYFWWQVISIQRIYQKIMYARVRVLHSKRRIRHLRAKYKICT